MALKLTPPVLLLVLLPPALLAALSRFTASHETITNTTATATTTYCYPYVYTLNDIVPSTRCFAVDGEAGRFVALANNTNDGDFGRVVEWDGSKHGQDVVVIPGLWDGHAHILEFGEMLDSVQLLGAKGVQDVRERVENFIALHPDQGTGENWIRGIGWDQALLFPGETTPHMPIAADLDSPLLRGKYMMLDRVDGHCVWISLAVLALLPHPLPTHIPGGVIMGEGSILCDNAIDLVYDVFPDKILSKEKIVKRMNAAMRELNKVGVVGVHDAGMRKWIVEGVRWMNEEGLLSVRVNAMLECPIRNTFCSGVGDDGVDSVMGKSDNGMLSVLGVKLYADGALGSWGAATLEPYTDKPGISGTLLINETALHKVITQWYSAGYQVSTHCIGDLANHIAIQTYKELLSAEPFSPPNQSRRLRIEHAQIITPEDQLVLQHWGIIPSIQPTHATSDAAYAEARLGKHRLLTRAYRMKSLFDRGLPVVLGSDFPVESHDPRNGIYAAVTRRNPYSEEVLPPFYPEEKITVHQALEGFIKNPAYAMWAEADTGDIAAGKWADWVVVRYAGGGDSGADKSLGSRFWEQEWLEKGGDVRKLEVLETWVAGRKVYDSSRSEEIQAEPMGAMNAMGWIQQVLGGK